MRNHMSNMRNLVTRINYGVATVCFLLLIFFHFLVVSFSFVSTHTRSDASIKVHRDYSGRHTKQHIDTGCASYIDKCQCTCSFSPTKQRHIREIRDRDQSTWQCRPECRSMNLREWIKPCVKDFVSLSIQVGLSLYVTTNESCHMNWGRIKQVVEEMFRSKQLNVLWEMTISTFSVLWKWL